MEDGRAALVVLLDRALDLWKLHKLAGRKFTANRLDFWVFGERVLYVHRRKPQLLYVRLNGTPTNATNKLRWDRRRGQIRLRLDDNWVDPLNGIMRLATSENVPKLQPVQLEEALSRMVW